MQGTNRTIARLALTRLLLGALLVAALAAAPAAAAASRAPTIKGAVPFQLPWDTYGSSVAIGPEGVPWFGATSKGHLSLFSVQAGTLQTVDLDPNRDLVGSGFGWTDFLRFDAEGNLWFVRSDKAGRQLARRAPDGTETLFPLAAKSHPRSLVAGPDGAFWFVEESAGKVGRISARGRVRFFALGAGVHPRQIVAGTDGNLWFSENGRPGPDKKSFDRIGRITTDGKVTQFPIGFGGGTEKLAADPRGAVWFTTEKGEISSISTAGTVGRRGCPGRCKVGFVSLAVAPDGTIWFALEREFNRCGGCGGGTDLILENEGSYLGEIPAGALRPAR